MLFVSSLNDDLNLKIDIGWEIILLKKLPFFLLTPIKH